MADLRALEWPPDSETPEWLVEVQYLVARAERRGGTPLLTEAEIGRLARIAHVAWNAVEWHGRGNAEGVNAAADVLTQLLTKQPEPR